MTDEQAAQVRAFTWLVSVASGIAGTGDGSAKQSAETLLHLINRFVPHSVQVQRMMDGALGTNDGGAGWHERRQALARAGYFDAHTASSTLWRRRDIY